MAYIFSFSDSQLQSFNSMYEQALANDKILSPEETASLMRTLGFDARVNPNLSDPEQCSQYDIYLKENCEPVIVYNQHTGHADEIYTFMWNLRYFANPRSSPVIPHDPPGTTDPFHQIKADHGK